MLKAASLALAISTILAPAGMMDLMIDSDAQTGNEVIIETETETETKFQTETESEELQKDYSWVEPESDLWLIAKVVCGEAQNCDRTEMEYVASVILNRVADPRFPNSVREVVYAPGQYSCVNDGNWQKVPTQANWEEAEYVLNMFNEHGYTVLPANVVFQSQSRQGSGVYLYTEWGHYYCY